MLKTELEELVVEAKKLGVELEDVTKALTQHWRRLDWTTSNTRNDEGGQE